jgi:SAM-dependent methyltransferase
MGVASHLNIEIDEYDARIRTFVPDYDQMLSTVVGALRFVDAEDPTIVDLGVGTGALAARCLQSRPAARLVGIDNDADMVAVAKVRLAPWESVDLRVEDFLESEIPSCDAIVASVALHHIGSTQVKQAFYGRCAEALRAGGIFVSADCFPAREPELARGHREAWLAHLRRSYAAAEAREFLSAWGGEDVYFALRDEMDWLGKAGLDPEVLWRRDGFAVLCGLAERIG